MSAANAPGVVVEPASLSFGEIADGGSGSIELAVRDLGGGSGDWSVSTRFVGPIPTGVAVSAPPVVSVPANGSASILVQTLVAPTAPAREGAGMLELVQGTRTRRVPFWLRVDRPVLVKKPFQTLRAHETRDGDTRGAGNMVSVYRYPTNVSPLGLPTTFDGPEQLWRFMLGTGVLNAGVSIETPPGVVAYPILMTERDESHVAGESGLPLNVGPLPSSNGIVPAAGLDAPASGAWWVAVESPPGKAGPYRIRLWVSDHTPPRIAVLGLLLRGRPPRAAAAYHRCGIGRQSGRRDRDRRRPRAPDRRLRRRDRHRRGRRRSALRRTAPAADPGLRSRRDEGRAVGDGGPSNTATRVISLVDPG